MINNNLKDKQYYIFDLDGTITDSMGLWAITEIEVVKEKLNIDIKYDSLADGWHKINPLVEGLDKSLKIEIYKECNKRMMNKYDFVKPKDKVLEFINKAYQEGKQMCIATNTPLELVNHILERLNIKHCFKFILTVFDDNVKVKKHDPKIFLECAKRFNTKYNECIIFEDSYEYTIKPKDLGFNIIGIYDETHKDCESSFKLLANQYIYSYQELL